MQRRKIAVLVGDGMGDYPVAELGGRTPLQAARIPNMRRLAAAGTAQLVYTVPPGIQPGSDVANMSLLGYNPAAAYTGRAPIEAAGAGIPLGPADVAFRCNLVTIADGVMKDYSAGEIASAEAHQLIRLLDEKAGGNGLHFHGGVSYRHLLVWENGPVNLITQPPHDIADRAVADYLPRGERQEEARALMDLSAGLFASHSVNEARRKAGRRTATQIWLWGQGQALSLAKYPELFGLSGGVVSAVDLIRGLGKLAGLRADRIPGATGFVDTDYEAKVRSSVRILEEGDFVFVHVEAPDECGHKGLLKLKVEAIEAFDKRVVGPIWEYLERQKKPYRLVVCTDHRTPVSIKGHTSEAVPMAFVDGPVGPTMTEAPFDEFIDGGRIGGMAFDIFRELLAVNGTVPDGPAQPRAV